MSEHYPIGVIPCSAEDGGGYLGIVGDLPGCMSYGDTPEEALKSAQQAILEWLDEAKEQGIAIPEPGSAGVRMRQDRANLVAQLQNQKQAFDKLENEVTVLRASLDALLIEARVSDDQQPTWMAGAIYAAGKKREHNLQ